MNERKSYAVVELAELVNVPRTTLNDWLERFSQYIESEIRGKRKVYFDSSVKVLKEIAELRNAGMAANEIEVELTKRHPVQAEVAPQASTAPAPTAESGELIAPVARQQAEEIGRMLGKELQNIAERMENARELNSNFARRSLRWYILAIGLIVALGATALVFTLKTMELLKLQDGRIVDTMSMVGKVSQQGLVITSEMKKRDVVVQDQNQKLQKLTVLIDKNSTDYQKNVETLQQELAKQREDFKAMLEKTAQTADSKTQIELAAIKDFFAREKLELLKKSEELTKEIGERSQLVEQLQAEQKKLTVENQDKIDKLEKKAIDDKNEIAKNISEGFKKQRAEDFNKIGTMSREIGDKAKQIEALHREMEEQRKLVESLKQKLDKTLTAAPPVVAPAKQ
jgi:DNA-binding transcriptional MerR regulator